MNFHSLYIGPIRIFLVFLLLYFANNHFFKIKMPKDKLNYLINSWVRFGSGFYLLVVGLQTVGYYDLFTVLITIVIVVVIYVFDLKVFSFLTIRQKSNYFMLNLVYNLENENKRLFKTNTIVENFRLSSFLVWLNLLIVGGVLMYFIQYDIFSSTHLWSEDLLKIYDFNNQLWFQNRYTTFGDIPFLSMYVKLTGISIEMGLRSFGVVEILMLTLVLYWVVNRTLTKSYIISSFSMIAGISLFLYLPININLITLHSPVFLSLSFVLPIVVYMNNLPVKIIKKRYFITRFGLTFLAVFFIDVMIYIMVLPVFIILSIIFSKHRSYVLKFLYAYLVALVVGLLYLYLFSKKFTIDYVFKNELINLNSFMDFKQLIMPWESLSLIYLYLTIILLVISAVFKKIFKIRNSMKVFIYGIMVMLIFIQLNLVFIDVDELTKIVAYMVPLLLTIFIFSFAKFFYNMKLVIPDGILTTIKIMILGVFLGGSFYIQRDKVIVENVSENYANSVLEAYNNILINNLPYTYLVVNDSSKFMLNNNKHYLMSYYDFFTNYLDRDVLFNRYKDDKEVLKVHPEYVLPNSIYVFTYDCTINNDESLISVKEQESALNNKLNVFCNVNIVLNELISRGRTVKEFYKKGNIIVYEIVNVPKSSNMLDLIIE